MWLVAASVSSHFCCEQKRKVDMMATSEKVVVAGSSLTARMMKDLWRQIDDGSLTGAHIKAMLEHRDPFQIEVPVDWERAYWALGYPDAYKDLQARIPERVSGCWYIPVVKGITCSHILNVFNNLGNKVDVAGVELNDETYWPNCLYDGAHIVRIKAGIDCDQDLRGQSAESCGSSPHGAQCISLRQYLLLVFAYQQTTNSRLDLGGRTLCAGSRFHYHGGERIVPVVHWDSSEPRGKLVISTVSSGEHSLKMGARRVLEWISC